MTWTLDNWHAWSPVLERVYQEELGRSAFSDQEAFVNWTFHWREEGWTESAVRAAIRESPEWRQRHGAGSTPPDAPPARPVPPVARERRVIHVTDEHDGRIAPRMMSDRANAFVQGDDAIVFCGTTNGPRFFRVHLPTGGVVRLKDFLAYGGETEGWYWLRDGRVVLPDGPRLRCVNPFNPSDERIVLDISDTHPGCDLWQPHSSDDGLTHSATVRRIVQDGKYPYVGTVIESPHGRRFEPAVGQLDESQVTRSGSHCVIKQNGDDNRIIDLATGAAWDLADADGAFGHSDCGPDYIVGECNLPGPGRCVKMNLRTRERTTLFETHNLGYVSVRGGRCLRSSDTHLSLVDLETGTQTPIVTLDHPAIPGSPGYYNQRAKANLDPTGQVATYMDGGAVKLLVL